MSPEGPSFSSSLSPQPIGRTSLKEGGTQKANETFRAVSILPHDEVDLTAVNIEQRDRISKDTQSLQGPDWGNKCKKMEKKHLRSSSPPRRQKKQVSRSTGTTLGTSIQIELCRNSVDEEAAKLVLASRRSTDSRASRASGLHLSLASLPSPSAADFAAPRSRGEKIPLEMRDYDYIEGFCFCVEPGTFSECNAKCCFGFLEVVMMVVNTLLFLSGVYLAGQCFYTLIARRLLTNDMGEVFVVLLLGLLHILTAVGGCVGSHRVSRKYLSIYLLSVSVLFTVVLILGVDQVISYFRLSLLIDNGAPYYEQLPPNPDVEGPLVDYRSVRGDFYDLWQENNCAGGMTCDQLPQGSLKIGSLELNPIDAGFSLLPSDSVSQMCWGSSNDPYFPGFIPVVCSAAGSDVYAQDLSSLLELWTPTMANIDSFYTCQSFQNQTYSQASSTGFVGVWCVIREPAFAAVRDLLVPSVVMALLTTPLLFFGFLTGSFLMLRKTPRRLGRFSDV